MAVRITMAGIRRPVWALGMGVLLAVFGSWVGSREVVDDLRTQPLSLQTLASENGTWLARVEPVEVADRATVTVDGTPVPGAIDPATGVTQVGLEGLEPGHHHIEVLQEYRGQRIERVRDDILVGPFEEGPRPLDACDIGIQLTGQAIDEVVVPAISQRLLTAVSSVDVLGPETRLEQANLFLEPGVIGFEVALASENRLEVHARVRVQTKGGHQVVLTLESLDRVEFTGSLRQKATVGGATVGALVTGPFAPVGAVVGYYLADGYVERRAREEVENQITRALAQATELAVVPKFAQLISGEPRSEVALRLCRPLEVDPKRGIYAQVQVQPVVVEGGGTLRIPGPVDLKTTLPGPPIARGEDVSVRLDVSLMLVNRLMFAWTQSGLLADWVRRGQLVERVNESLADWTTLQVQGFQTRLPPQLRVASRGQNPWQVALMGWALEIEGPAGSPSEVVLAAQGTVAPTVAGSAGPLRLTAHIDGLWVDCEDVSSTGQRRRKICIGSLLDYTDIRAQLNARLEPGAPRLPTLDVERFVRTHTGDVQPGGLKLARLHVEPAAEARDVVRLSATIHP